MPEAAFNKNLNLPTNQGIFLTLDKKGDKIKFRIANTPHYETIHWIADKEFKLCGRYNSDNPKAPCQYCDIYQKEKQEGKKDLDIQLTPQTTFYYPVLDLNTGLPAVFRFKAKSIHWSIKGYADEEIDVFACDWSVERTEEPGNYYVVKRLGDKKLSPELQAEYDNAKKLQLKAKESKSVSVTTEAEPGE